MTQNKGNQDRQIHFRLSESEFEKLKKSAEVLGLKSANIYVRKLAEKSRIKKPYISNEMFEPTLRELKYQGKNLNQVTAILNSERIRNNQISVESWNKAFARLNQINAEYLKILEMLESSGKNGDGSKIRK